MKTTYIYLHIDMSQSQYMDNYAGKMNSFVDPTVKQYGSHMVMTDVMKPTRTKYINIDTRFTDDYVYGGSMVSGTGNGNGTGTGCGTGTGNGTSGFNYGGTAANGYTMTLPERINEVKTIHVNSVELPMTFYNISAAMGNSFFRINDSQMIVVPDGYYATVADLIAAVHTAVDSATDGGLSFVVADNQSGGSSSSSIYGMFVSTAGSYTIHFNVDMHGNEDKYLLRSKLGWLLGFREPSGVATPGADYYAVSAINIRPIRYVYLVVDEFGNNFQNSFLAPMGSYVMNRKILARISIDTGMYPYGSVLVANHSNGYLVSDTRSYNGKMDLQRLNIQVVTEWGVPIHLNGLDFSFILQVTYEN